jgi:hypothetical protein
MRVYENCIFLSIITNVSYEILVSLDNSVRGKYASVYTGSIASP